MGDKNITLHPFNDTTTNLYPNVKSANIPDTLDKDMTIKLVKTNEVDNTNGNAMVRFKETENKVVLGDSTIPTTIMGSGDRPTYSKDGSDFSGEELALLSDVGGGGLPTDPTTDGSYVLGNDVSSGEGSHSWSATEKVDFVSLPAVDTTTDGTYVLKAVVSSGELTFSWVKE